MQRHTDKGYVTPLGERDVMAITFADTEEEEPDARTRRWLPPSLAFLAARTSTCQEGYM
jgi:hypothetical protein